MPLQTPIIITNKSGIVQNIFWLFFGVFWIALITFIAFSVHRAGNVEVDVMGKPVETTSPLLFIFPFYLVGIGIFIMGLRGIHKTVITISPSEIRYNKNGAFRKTKEWNEPLKNFSGIIGKTREVRRGKHNYVTVYDVALEHPDSKKSLTLEIYRDQQMQRQRMDFFVKELFLPHLEKTVDGNIQVRKAEDLDKNIQVLVQEGKVKRTFASKNPYPQKKYKMIETKDGFLLKRTYHQMFFWGALIWSATALVYFYFAPKDNQLYGLALTLTVIGGFMFFSGFSQEVLAVAQNKIVYRTLIFGLFQHKYIIIPLDKVEEISIAHDYSMGNVKRFNKAIKVASDIGTFHFCHYTSESEREWLADKLIELGSGNIPKNKKV